MTDPAEIAAKLTRSQREHMTALAEWRSPAAWADKRWMTFPPPNTHMVLQRLGLVDSSGQILDLGLTVRAVLQEKV